MSFVTFTRGPKFLRMHMAFSTFYFTLYFILTTFGIGMSSSHVYRVRHRVSFVSIFRLFTRYSTLALNVVLLVIQTTVRSQ